MLKTLVLGWWWFWGVLHLNLFFYLGSGVFLLVGWFFNGNTVFKVKYLPLPDTPVRAL